MKLTIDNLDGQGPQDYTAYVQANSLSVARKLNAPAGLKVALVAYSGGFVVPATGGRVMVARSDGSNLFTGYLVATPLSKYCGWSDQGARYVYEITALSDVMMLDLKPTTARPPFVDRSAGSAFQQLTEDALPGWFDLSGVEAGDTIPYLSVDPAKTWGASAAEIALLARCSYRDDNGKLFLTPLGQNTYSLAESDATFGPASLQLQATNRLVNDLTILGELEPGAHVKDYFVGDGSTSRFYLSQIPFTRKSDIPSYNRTILDETYTELDPTHWVVTDPTEAIAVSAGLLQVAGGTGADGQTYLRFVEQVELGGATVLEHGDIVFSAASEGVVGGLYAGAVAIANCVAGFRIAPSGSNSTIQALVNGALTGTVLTTMPGHHYIFATQLYPDEIYRLEQTYHSSQHPSGNPRGATAMGSSVRVVLEVHDIDPANPATQVAPATVLYDGLIANAPDFCTYALINSANLRCAIEFTYLYLAVDAMVRSTVQGQSEQTLPVGSLLEGGQCRVSETPTLEFYSPYIPQADQAIEVSYRAGTHAMARVMNSASIAALKNGLDDGVRGALRQVQLPKARTAADCENAALALLDDAGQGWAGEYQAWNQFLPGAAGDIYPGDGLNINVASRNAVFLAIVREVDILVVDMAGENSRYSMRFVDAGDPLLDFTFGPAAVKESTTLTPIDVSQVGNVYLPDLTDADFTDVTSTTVIIDAGFTPPSGWGIEVRTSDTGWGMTNSGNLIGRYAVSTFTLSRFARAQGYFLRSYDNSSPPRYSRYSAALYVDYPL